MLGLPENVRGCLFDLDGVLTQTAKVHAAAWKEMFDDFLRRYAEKTGTAFVPFDPIADYDTYVDGKPRLDGTRSFLESRGIHLPEGTPEDPPGTPTIYGLSNQKNDLVLKVLQRDGVEVYEGSSRYINAVRDAGLRTAIVSSSANTEQVLKAGGISDLFDTISYAHDPRNDFMNWALVDAGTFDYAADAWGFTYGAALEWYQSAWTARAGFFDLSNVPNSVDLNSTFSEYQLVYELEHRHSINTRTGKTALVGFVTRGRMGRFDDAVALAKWSAMAFPFPDLQSVIYPASFIPRFPRCLRACPETHL